MVPLLPKVGLDDATGRSAWTAEPSSLWMSASHRRLWMGDGSANELAVADGFVPVPASQVGLDDLVEVRGAVADLDFSAGCLGGFAWPGGLAGRSVAVEPGSAQCYPLA